MHAVVFKLLSTTPVCLPQGCIEVACDDMAFCRVIPVDQGVDMLLEFESLLMVLVSVPCGGVDARDSKWHGVW